MLLLIQQLFKMMGESLEVINYNFIDQKRDFIYFNQYFKSKNSLHIDNILKLSNDALQSYCYIHNINLMDALLYKSIISKSFEPINIFINNYKGELLSLIYTYRYSLYEFIPIIEMFANKFNYELNLQFQPKHFIGDKYNLNEMPIKQEFISTFTKLYSPQLYEYQFEAITTAITKKSKNDFGMIITAPTGAGKSLTYLIPSIIFACKRMRSILIYPTKALANDQLNSIARIQNELLKIGYSFRIAIYDGDTPSLKASFSRKKKMFSYLDVKLCEFCSIKSIYCILVAKATVVENNLILSILCSKCNFSMNI